MMIHPHSSSTQAMGRADLHVHSAWSDGAQSPAEIVQACAGRLDVVAITDHDEIRGAMEARAFAQARPELGVEVVVGEEISTLNGHLLGLYLQAPVPPGLPAAETIGLIHQQGGLAVAAHPFHPLRGSARGHHSLGTMIADLPLDAIEIVNNAGIFSWLYDAWAALHNVDWGLAVAGGSDAHDGWYVGNAGTRFGRRSGGRRGTGVGGGRYARPPGLGVDRRQDAAPRPDSDAKPDPLPDAVSSTQTLCLRRQP